MKKHIYYIFSHLYAYGELPSQIWCLRNLFYDQDNYDITVFTYPLQKNRVNTSLFNIVMRGINVIHLTDDKLVWFFVDKNSKYIIKENDNIYISLNSSQLIYLFLKKYSNQKPKYFFSLSKAEKKMGEKLKNDFDIPENTPIVTLHVRESGFKTAHGVPEGPDSPPRNANIENYLPAIEYLINKGYYVIRLGDVTMKALPEMKGLIDGPFHPSWNSLADPFFISESQFMIGASSGPSNIADGFNIPRLLVNITIIPPIYSWENDVFLFKKYYSRKLKRFLNYKEILCSNILNIDDIEKAENNEIEIIENSSEEILEAVKEMIARLEGNYIKFSEMRGLNRYFLNIQQEALKIHSLNYSPIISNMVKNNYCPISLEYLRLNPYFVEL